MKKLWIYFFVIFITLPSHQTRPSTNLLFIIWNVGQGSWNTLVTSGECIHLDMGGQKPPWRLVRQLCSHRKNQIFISHGDKDHMKFIKLFFKRFSRSCLHRIPEETSYFYKISLKKLPSCTKKTKFVKKIWSPKYDFKKTKNDLSAVYIIKKKILFSGDSPIAEEKQWAYLLPFSLKVLILGHHGSYTSNGVSLLSKLSQISLSVASARKKTYGHPHSKVKKRLQKHKIPLLETQIWGHIILEL